jgi:hypothetical protein
MSSDYDIKIKSLFDRANTGQPAEAFIQEVMMNIRRQERKAKLFRLVCLLAVIPLLWVMSPELEGLVVSVNGFVEITSNMTVTLIKDLSLSPVTWIFVFPPLAYYLYFNRHQFI